MPLLYLDVLRRHWPQLTMVRRVAAQLSVANTATLADTAVSAVDSGDSNGNGDGGEWEGDGQCAGAKGADVETAKRRLEALAERWRAQAMMLELLLAKLRAQSPPKQWVAFKGRSTATPPSQAPIAPTDGHHSHGCENGRSTALTPPPSPPAYDDGAIDGEDGVGDAGVDGGGESGVQGSSEGADDAGYQDCGESGAGPQTSRMPAGGWQVVGEGEDAYYWHPASGITSWDRPAEADPTEADLAEAELATSVATGLEATPVPAVAAVAAPSRSMTADAQESISSLTNAGDALASATAASDTTPIAEGATATFTSAAPRLAMAAHQVRLTQLVNHQCAAALLQRPPKLQGNLGPESFCRGISRGASRRWATREPSARKLKVAGGSLAAGAATLSDADPLSVAAAAAALARSIAPKQPLVSGGGRGGRGPSGGLQGRGIGGGSCAIGSGRGHVQGHGSDDGTSVIGGTAPVPTSGTSTAMPRAESSYSYLRAGYRHPEAVLDHLLRRIEKVANRQGLQQHMVRLERCAHP